MKRTTKKEDHIEDRKTPEIEPGIFYTHRADRAMSIHMIYLNNYVMKSEKLEKSPNEITR